MNGWKLVPVEPTPEMIAAWPNGRHGAGHEAAIYRAMLAAAPATPAAPPAAQAGDALPPTDPRFFLDHGVIHDRMTGLHVHGDMEADAYGVQRELDALNSMARADHLLRELLAVMHRDGGHYAVEHGLKKAKEDAVQVYYDLAARGAQAGDEPSVEAVFEAMSRIQPNWNAYGQPRERAVRLALTARALLARGAA